MNFSRQSGRLRSDSMNISRGRLRSDSLTMPQLSTANPSFSSVAGTSLGATSHDGVALSLSFDDKHPAIHEELPLSLHDVSEHGTLHGTVMRSGRHKEVGSFVNTTAAGAAPLLPGTAPSMSHVTNMSLSHCLYGVPTPFAPGSPPSLSTHQFAPVHAMDAAVGNPTSLDGGNSFHKSLGRPGDPSPPPDAAHPRHMHVPRQVHLHHPSSSMPPTSLSHHADDDTPSLNLVPHDNDHFLLSTHHDFHSPHLSVQEFSHAGDHHLPLPFDRMLSQPNSHDLVDRNNNRKNNNKNNNRNTSQESKSQNVVASVTVIASTPIVSPFKRRRHPQSPELRLFVCKFDNCDYTARHPQTLENHIRARHTKDKPFACAQCPYKAAQKMQLVRHMLSHNDVKPFRCTYEGCGYSTTQKTTLDSHIAAKHTGDKKHVCLVCEYTTVSSSHLKRHVRARHEHDMRFSCEVIDCRYRTSDRSNLNAHCKRVHNLLVDAVLVDAAAAAAVATASAPLSSRC